MSTYVYCPPWSCSFLICFHVQYLPIVPSQLNFKPIIDGKIIPDDPKRLFTAHEYNKMPVMIGVLEDEWARSMGWFFRELNESMIGECVALS